VALGAIWVKGAEPHATCACSIGLSDRNLHDNCAASNGVHRISQRTVCREGCTRGFPDPCLHSKVRARSWDLRPKMSEAGKRWRLRLAMAPACLVLRQDRTSRMESMKALQKSTTGCPARHYFPQSHPSHLSERDVENNNTVRNTEDRIRARAALGARMKRVRALLFLRWTPRPGRGVEPAEIRISEA